MSHTDISSQPGLQGIISEAVNRQVDEQRVLSQTLDGLREAVSQATSDTQVLAQAVRDLNAGMQESYRELDARVGSLATSVLDGLRELASTQQSGLEGLAAALGSSTTRLVKEVAESVRGAVASLTSRMDDLHDGYAESADITAYLRDQADDLDRILAALGDIPRKLEGVVAQALRRALTVRAGLIREAEKALDRTMGPVEDKVRELARELGYARRGGGSKARKSDPLLVEIRELARAQADLAARVEELVAAAPASAAAADPAAVPHPKPKAAATKKTKKAKKKTMTAARVRKPAAEPEPDEPKPAGRKTAGRKTAEPEPELKPTRRPRRRNYIPV